MDTRLLKLGISGVMSEVASRFYSATGVDMTHPTHVYAEVTRACDSRCVMCDVWGDQDKSELPAQDWIKALQALRSHLNTVKVSLAGGEVFLKRDIFEIFQACTDAGIPFGIATNGITLSPENVEAYLECRPVSLSISLDTLDPRTYHEIRGTPSLGRVLENIDSLMDLLNRDGHRLAVTLKTVVNAKNLDELPALAAYAGNIGICGVTFDPIRRRREPFISGEVSEFEELFSMDPVRLRGAVAELTRLKRAGYPILNSEENMRQWLRYADAETSEFCKVPLNTLYVDHLGDIRLCDYSSLVVGNIRLLDLRSVWNQDRTRLARRELTRCQRSCVYCVRRSMREYVGVFRAYARNGRFDRCRDGYAEGVGDVGTRRQGGAHDAPQRL